jgi:hypothetical protein
MKTSGRRPDPCHRTQVDEGKIHELRLGRNFMGVLSELSSLIPTAIIGGVGGGAVVAASGFLLNHLVRNILECIAIR